MTPLNPLNASTVLVTSLPDVHRAPPVPNPLPSQVVSLGADLPCLAEAAALEAVTALGLQPSDELSLDLFCEIVADFLKLSSLY